MQLRICHVTTGHALMDDRIFHKEALSMVRRGFRVFVVGPSLSKRTEAMGVDMRGVRPPIIKWNLLRKFVLLARIKLVLLGLGCHVYHCHEMDAVLAALPRVFLGSKVIYDVHEHFPENFEGRLARPWLYMLHLLDRFVTRVAHSVVVVDETLAKKYRSARNVLVIHNYPMLQSYRHKTAARNDDLAIYVGGLSEERGVWEMIEAVRLARRERPDFRLLLVGRFIPQELRHAVQEKITELGLSEAVEIVDWIPFESIPDVLEKASMGISFLRGVPRYKAAVPIKIYEYMAAGIPVIASDFKRVADLLESEGCGITAAAGDSESLSRAIVTLTRDRDLAREMGRKGYEAVRKRLNWETESEVLLRCYERFM